MDQFILNLLQKQKRRIIGLRSGNSGNGFELVVLEISGSGLNTKFKILYTGHQVYPPRQKQFLVQLRDPRQHKPQLIKRINSDLTRSWAETINEMLTRTAGPSATIDVIGLLGTTVKSAAAGLNSAAAVGRSGFAGSVDRYNYHR